MPGSVYIKITEEMVKVTKELPVPEASQAEINIDYDEDGQIVGIEVLDALSVTTDSGVARTVKVEGKEQAEPRTVKICRLEGQDWIEDDTDEDHAEYLHPRAVELLLGRSIGDEDRVTIEIVEQEC